MTRRFYAASNSYGLNFTYDSPGWTVHVFDSSRERDCWVDADPYPNGNPTRETVSAKTAQKIEPELRYEYPENCGWVMIHKGDQMVASGDLIR